MLTDRKIVLWGLLGVVVTGLTLWAIASSLARPNDKITTGHIITDLLNLQQSETKIDECISRIATFHDRQIDQLNQSLTDFQRLRDRFASQLHLLRDDFNETLTHEMERYFSLIDTKVDLARSIGAKAESIHASVGRLREEVLTLVDQDRGDSPHEFAHRLNVLMVQAVSPDFSEKNLDALAVENEIERLFNEDSDLRETYESIRRELAVILHQRKALHASLDRIKGIPSEDQLGRVSDLLLGLLDRKLAAISDSTKTTFLITVSALLVLMLIALVRLHDAHRQAESSRIRLNDAIESIPVGFSLYDKDEKLVLWNKKLEEFFPTISGRMMVGMNFRALMLAAAKGGQFEPGAKNLRPFLRTLLSRQKRTDGGIYHKTSDGRYLFALDNPVSDGGTVSVLVDVTETKKIEEKLRKLSVAVEQSPVSVIITDTEGTIEYVNKTFTSMTGWSSDEVIGRNPRILKSGYTSASEYSDMWKTLLEGREWSGELHNRRKNGELFWEHSLISPIRDDNGETTHFIAVKEDITEKKNQEALLYRHTRYDQLTNLPNRAMAAESLHTAIALARRTGCLVGVMFIDLDNFKNVNDSLGHGAGDILLQQSAKRITQRVRELNVVARLGGDEFCVIIPELSDQTDAITIARELLRDFEKPFQVAGQTHYTTISVGIAIYPENGSEPHNLMRSADSALFSAKDSGRNTFAFFSEQLDLAIKEKRKIESRLRQAIEDEILEVYYQPLVSAENTLIVGAEALCRWKDKKLGWVPPDRFISIAEERGLISEIGRQVLFASCVNAKKWQAQDPSFQRIAVNVSTCQLQGDEGFVAMLKSTIDETGIDANSLELEITESLLLDNFSGSMNVLSEIRDLGVSISIDDFGTGYSSLSYLKKFRFDTLKIDRTFVRDIVDDSEARTLVRSLISMAQALNLEMIAEGVEDGYQMDQLRDFGCKLLQGYLFCKPIPADEFEPLLLKKEPLLQNPSSFSLETAENQIN